MDKLLIIDGNSIANRAFYALPFLSNHKGEPTGAVYGFANILIKTIQVYQPTHIVVAFDHARKTFRNQIYADYKGTRKPTPPELTAQFPVVKQMLKIMGIQTFEFENIEADDIIGSICNKTTCEKIILSGDRDLLQLIDNKTTVCLTKKGVTEVALMDKSALKAELNLEPYQIIELKALMGDSSDNIPGVKGVGEKTALGLLEKYTSVKGIYNNIENITGKLKDKLVEGENDAYMSKTLATIKTDCDFDFSFDNCKLQFPFDGAVLSYFNEMDFTTLVKNKTLFKEDVEPIEKIKVQRVDLLGEKEIDEILNTVSDYFSYNLKEMTFAVDNKTEYYLSQN